MHRHFEPIEKRTLFAVTAFFDEQLGLVSVSGDALDNVITVGRDTVGNLRVNNGAVAIVGGTATVANTAKISIFGAEESDNITLDETNGALPAAEVFGGDGNDTITGGSGADTLFGQSGNDALLGKGGFDLLSGGTDNDTLTGGDADDQVFGESGNDRMIWNPGDDTDLNEGGDGADTVEVNGGNGAEVFTTTANGLRVRFDRLDPAPLSIDIGTSENLTLNANGGNDSFSATGNLATLISVVVDGGGGLDTILGSNGIDQLSGGDDADFIDGQQGNDNVFLGAGDDVFQWDPGDGSDAVEGQDGADTMVFNGSAGSEIFDASANGTRVRFTRNLGSIVMDLADVEKINLFAGGSVDSITVNDMTGTDLTEMNVNLSSLIGGTTGDTVADTVIVTGSNSADDADVLGVGASFSVVGFQTLVNVTNSEGANDFLTINALDGSDTIAATTLPAGVVKLAVNGGSDNDTINGSQGNDTLTGSDGNDFIFGDNGNDLALMGDGNDLFQWDPGDGNDTIEGQGDSDTMVFNGSAAAENVDIVANGARVLFLRNVANVTMDMAGVENINFAALGGADNVVVGDLTGTDMAMINVNLAATLGGAIGDGAVDSITYNGPQVDDVILVTGSSGPITVDGPAANVVISNTEAALDKLTVNSLGGNDVVDASGLAAGNIAATFNGGLGNDTITGSQGDDLFAGGDGNDLALMGSGADTFVWNPGDDNDTLEGQAGVDTMLFNGANVAETITISANGNRLRFFRDIANVTMDANDLERVQFNALGGADNITVSSLVGTDVTNVTLELAVGGAGDAQPDTININGSAGVDAMNVSADAANGFTISGTSATVNVKGVELANDRFNFRPLGGADVVTFNTISGFTGMPMLVELEAAVGGATADGFTDQVTGNFGNDAELVSVTDTVAGTLVTGGGLSITLAHADSASDSLRLNLGGAFDVATINQSGSPGSVRRVLLDGGSEQDTITITNTAADGSVTILPSTGNDDVSINSDGLFQANAIFAGTQRIGSLSIGPAGKATLAANGSSVLTASSVNITGTGQLDLTDNSAIIDYSGNSPITTVLQRLTSGFNGGAWNGPGIISSTSAADPKTGIGFAEATDLFGSSPISFKGQAIDGTSVLLSHTLIGDADLSGGVNSDDFNRLASNFGMTGKRWSDGNVNYDAAGLVNSDDFNLLATNFGLSAGSGSFSRNRIGSPAPSRLIDELADELIT